VNVKNGPAVNLIEYPVWDNDSLANIRKKCAQKIAREKLSLKSIRFLRT